MLLKNLRILFLLMLTTFISNYEMRAQCDVFIEPGSVVVTDNGSGVKFNFDVTNNSSIEWGGDMLKLYWTLNSSAPIWEIDYTNNNNIGPIQPGETRNITTPWFDIPNLPSWFPEDPTPSNPWLESSEWAYYDINVTGGPFTGAWSPMNLRLGSCSLSEGAWIYDEDGELYYGPFNSSCPDQNHDAFCDCDVDFIGFDPVTYDVSIEIISHLNCGTSLNTNGLSGEMDHINMLQIAAHVPGWDYNWGCTAAQYHTGWTWDNPISFDEFYAGDTINYNLFSDDVFYDDCFQSLLESDTLTSCLEVVLWQINYSETAIIGEIDGGWAVSCGLCANQTQFYPDISMGMNSINVCDSPPPLYPGCMDPEAENYDETAGYDDGTCTYPPVFGCTDPIGCNYNFLATQNDGSCVYCDTPNGEELCNEYHNMDDYWEWYSSLFDCEDEVFVDMQLDSIYFGEANCDIFNVGMCGPGIRYYTSYTNVSSDTIYSWYFTITGPNGYGYESPEYGINYPFNEDYAVPLDPMDTAPIINTVSGELVWEQGDTICITVNVIGQTDNNLDNNTYCVTIPFDYPVCIEGCTDPDAENYNPNATCENLDLCEYTSPDAGAWVSLVNTTCENGTPGNVVNILVVNPDTGNFNSTDTLFNYCVEVIELGLDTCLYGNVNGADVIPTGEGQLIWNNILLPDTINQITVNVYFAEDEDEELSNNNTLVYQNLIQNPEVCNIYGCTDESANNYNPDANVDDGSCTYDILGCTDPEANNYNSTANVDDGSCTYDVYGCTDSGANNYNPSATIDDGSCTYDVYGCTDESANNFNPNANVDDGSCEYDVYGCTDSTANNYNPNANVDDGSCTYDITELLYIDYICILGCDENGGYYTAEVFFDNVGNTTITDICINWDIIGAPDNIECWNGTLEPNETVILEFGPIYTDGGGGVVIRLESINGVETDITWFQPIACAQNAQATCVYGCTDSEANNYNPNADLDDGSCTYDVYGCTDSEANNYNPEANIDDGSCEYTYVGGCTDTEALNYNPDAEYDDGSCVYDSCQGEYFIPNTFTPNNDGVNDGWSIVTDSDCWLEWEVRIFNRWGGLVWISNIPGEVWPGSVFNGDHYVVDGVYIYTVRGVGYNPSHTFERSGHITIFR